NIGVVVLLLDIAPKELASEKKGVPAKASQAERNQVANQHLADTVRSNPSPIYSSEVLTRISTGNFEDHMKDVSSVDWIIEVVVERLDIKKQIFDDVEKYRKPGTLIT